MANQMRFATDLSKGILGAPDSEELWTEILSHIPDEVLLRPGVRILNMACGHGTPAVVLAKRMMSLGVPKSDVQDSVWLLDKYKTFTGYVTKKLGFKNVITADFLTWETDMKFDAVVGNPPYNLDGQKKLGAYPLFVEKIDTLIDSGSIVSLVLPSPWLVSPSYKNMRQSLLQKYKIEYLKLNGYEAFDAHVDTCSIVMTKGEATSTFKMVANDTFTMESFDGIIPKVKTEIEHNILKKIAGTSKLDIRRGVQETVRHHGEKVFTEHLSEKPTKNCPHKMLSRLLGGRHEYFYTSKVNDPDVDKCRVVFPYMPPAVANIGYVEVVLPGLQLSNSLVYVVVASEADGNELKEYLRSKCFKFLLEVFKTAPAWSAFIGNQLPAKNYMHLLTQEEIDYIESTVK